MDTTIEGGFADHGVTEMIDALLSLSVTYRQLIMPLVRAVEARVGTDAKMHQEVERLEGMIDNLRGAPPAK